MSSVFFERRLVLYDIITLSEPASDIQLVFYRHFPLHKARRPVMNTVEEVFARDGYMLYKMQMKYFAMYHNSAVLVRHFQNMHCTSTVLTNG